MHCPTCREENAPTTRFCTSCGAVLVEEAPEGGRRRVLRPWGLRRSAPPTVSPDLPEMGARVDRASGATRGGRADFWLAGGVVAAIAVGAMLYPTLRSEAGAPADAARAAATATAAAVALPAPAIVGETRLAAPGLVEAAVTHAAPKLANAPTPPPAAKPARPPAARPGSARSLPAAPVTSPMPPPESIIRDDDRVDVVAQAPVAAPPPPAAPQIVDRWQPLRDELARCQPLGLLQRAMCEQGARLAHCEGQWGQSDLCPAGRTEYGQ